jgi:hypothetical protein
MSGAQTVRLGFHDEQVAVGDHIAYFWETPAQFREGVRFLEVGVDAGDFCVIFGHDEANQRVRDILTADGFNHGRLEAEGQLAVVSGHADSTQMLTNIGVAFTAAIARGVRLIRLLGNIGWGRAGWPNEADIFEFEARVTGAAKQFPCVVVCMYDVHALPGHVMVHGAYETHPLTFCRNLVRQNTHYVEVDEYLRRLRESTDQ